MSKPVTPEEWLLALMQGYAIILREPEQYHRMVQEKISTLLVVSNQVLDTWKEREKNTTEVDFQVSIQTELMKGEGILSQLVMLGKMQIEGAPRFPLSVAYKWHEGWYGLVASLHTHL